MDNRKAKYWYLIPDNVMRKLPEIELNPPAIPGFQIDYLKEIISIISFSIRKDKDEWASLKTIYLMKLVPQGYQYLRYLLDVGIIERDAYYQVGQKAYRYNFSYKYWSKYVLSPVDNLRLIRRIEKHQRFMKKMNSKKYAGQNKFLRNMTIESEAKNFIEQNFNEIDKYNYSLAAIKKIERGDIFWSVDETSGRFHSPMTNLPKELRQFIRVNGEPLTNVDVANSQPYLSTLILTNPGKISMFAKNRHFAMFLNGLYINDTEDVKRYVSLAVSGQLYEYLWHEFEKRGLRFTSRNEVKRQVFIILFSPNRMITPYRKIFRELFPEVHRVFCLVRGSNKGDKFKSFKRFSILLQSIEVHLILNVILRRINNDYPEIITLTIHDSIMTSIYTNDMKKVAEIMSDELMNFVGHEPILKIENEILQKKEELIII